MFLSDVIYLMLASIYSFIQIYIYPHLKFLSLYIYIYLLGWGKFFVSFSL